MRGRLLGADELERSPVVANCAMNRERRLSGANGYAREVGFEILPFLLDRLENGPVAWVDLCCGTGRALAESAAELNRLGVGDRVRIEGVDLAGRFDRNPFPDLLTLREASIEAWTPTGPYDLVTCVHGLHYVGDKLGALAKGASGLKPDSVLIATLDLANFRDGAGRPLGRLVARRLRDAGHTYDSRRRRVRRVGPTHPDFGLTYLGADDALGPNFTGQPAVASHYSAETEP